jgi:putative SOS response-associated peptidase YedK
VAKALSKHHLPALLSLAAATARDPPDRLAVRSVTTSPAPDADLFDLHDRRRSVIADESGFSAWLRSLFIRRILN